MKPPRGSTHLPIFLLLLIALVIGFFTVADFGQSWDEVPIYRYGDYALDAYRYFLSPESLPDFRTNLNLYGPAYFMITAWLSRLIMVLNPSWSIITANHLIYFVTYLACTLVLYFVSLRWMSHWAAFGTALLFLTQPLLWGHAFINPKDIAFMTFFMASIHLGFQMIDAPSNFRWARILAAGILLGLTVSIRIIGPWAGLLVAGYGLLKSPRKMIGILPFYFVIAAAIAYLTWPYLWKAPIANLLDSLRTMSNFPEVKYVLFMGALYPSDEIPLTYFPTFLALQLTEPALILIVTGTALSFWLLMKGKSKEPALLLAGWFIVPTLLILSSHSALYDNARQLLFLWPPLFIVSGIAIDRSMEIIKIPVLKGVLLLVIALPGMYACLQLHPYEYIYYNGLIGGVQGAYRKFDLDYWGISFKEAMNYVNDYAEEGTQVIVIGPRQLVKQYARRDLEISGFRRLDTQGIEYYYGIFLTRSNEDQDRCREAETVFTVERDDGILAYVKKVKPGQECW